MLLDTERIFFCEGLLSIGEGFKKEDGELCLLRTSRTAFL